MAFEPAAAGPADGVNGQMLALAYQAPEPFQPFTGHEAAAEGYIGVWLHLRWPPACQPHSRWGPSW
jgi:hypothetical protein